MLLVDFGVEDDGDVYVTAVFITLKSILVVDLLGLDKLTTAYGILSLLEGVGSLAGTPLIGTLGCTRHFVAPATVLHTTIHHLIQYSRFKKEHYHSPSTLC